MHESWVLYSVLTDTTMKQPLKTKMLNSFFIFHSINFLPEPKHHFLISIIMDLSCVFLDFIHLSGIIWYVF